MLGLLEHASHCALAVGPGVPQHGDARVLRDHLAEQLEPLGDELRAEKTCPGNVPAWSSKRGDQLVRNGIGHADHDNRSDTGRFFERPRGRRTQRDDDIKPVPDQFSRNCAQSIGIRFAKPALDGDVLPFDVTKLAQTHHDGVERDQACVSADRAAGCEESDARRSCPPLRPRAKRPCRCCAADQRDELATPHSITSSARASKVGGTSRPSALAVLRLITNSYLVGACTGRSAGFSPLRMRSTYDAPRRNKSKLSNPYDIKP